jgi:predicted small secreted protein
MKFLILIATLASLTSCNTMVGLWRDSKASYHWTKDKIQNSGGSSQGQYGAPVY